jgi:hypothetical protein
VRSIPSELCDEFDKLGLKIVANTKVMEMEVGSTPLQKIQKGQLEDEKIQEIKCNIKEEKLPGFTEDDQGVLWYKERVCVPNITELKDKILREAHESAYSINPGGNKMYHDLKAHFPTQVGPLLTRPAMPLAHLAFGPSGHLAQLGDAFPYLQIQPTHPRLQLPTTTAMLHAPSDRLPLHQESELATRPSILNSKQRRTPSLHHPVTVEAFKKSTEPTTASSTLHNLSAAIKGCHTLASIPYTDPHHPLFSSMPPNPSSSNSVGHHHHSSLPGHLTASHARAKLQMGSTLHPLPPQLLPVRADELYHWVAKLR